MKMVNEARQGLNSIGLCLITGSLLILSACGGGGGGSDSGDVCQGAQCTAPDTRKAEINSYVVAIDDELPTDEKLDVLAIEDPKTDEDYICTTSTVDEAKKVNTFFESSSDVIWPGALLRGADLEGLSYTPISLERGPMTISVSGTNFDVISKTIESPTTSTVREAVAEIFNSHYEDTATPADFSFEMKKVTSTQKLSVALEAAGGNLTTEVSGQFSSDTTSIRSTTVARFRQVYFSIDMDTPTTPADVFADSVTAADVEEQAGERNPPMYVSSVTYGRVAYFIVESSYSSQEVEAAMQGSYDGVANNVQIGSAYSIGKIMDESAIKVVIYGGAAESAIKAINGYAEFREFIESGADFSEDSPAKPIAFKLRYLSNNKDAGMSIPATYEERTCQRWNQRIRLQLTKISIAGGDGGNGLEIFGNLGRVYRYPSQHSGDYFTFANRPTEDDKVYVPKNSNTVMTNVADTSKDIAFNIDTYNSIRIYADVWESDTSPDADDHYGDGYTAYLYYPDDFNKEFSLSIKSGSDTVKLVYQITPL